MIRNDDRRPGYGEAIGADHLESIDGAHQATEETANLRIGRSGKRHETFLCAEPRNNAIRDWYCDSNGKNGAMPLEHRSAGHL
jgi:hypothetical protein